MTPLDQIDGWSVDSAAAVVVSRSGIVDARGPAAELAWASVTKLLTALVVLDAVYDGLVDLDEPAGPPGSTVRHLLAHASGIGVDDERVLAAPGRSRIYSNTGYEILGAFLTERTGTALPDRMRERVLEPLGLQHTRLAGSPAHGARGPVADLAALGHELLAPTVLDADLVATAARTAFPGLAGVLPGFGRQNPNDWGLGPEIRSGKRPHWTGEANSPETFGHFGRAGGFLWVDPSAGLALACLTDRDFGPWAAEVWPRLSDDVLAAYGQQT